MYGVLNEINDDDDDKIIVAKFNYIDLWTRLFRATAKRKLPSVIHNVGITVMSGSDKIDNRLINRQKRHVLTYEGYRSVKNYETKRKSSVKLSFERDTLRQNPQSQ